MRVEVIKPFGRYSIGAEIPEMPANQARTLIARGLVREVAAIADRQVARPPVDRMLRGRRAQG